jgi:hypothetical protein
MNAEVKTSTIAGGLILVTLVSDVVTLVAGAQLSVEKSAFRLALTVILAFTLHKRANWARWWVGILQTIGLLVTPLIFMSELFKEIFYSWVGIWVLLLFSFNLWVAYSLLIDRSVRNYFTGMPENTAR